VIGGFVPAWKPPGMGSAEIVGRLKRTIHADKVGHTGTLDRFAEGLMLLVVGRSTCLCDFFLHADKRYSAIFSFGKSTETHDPEGSVLEERGEDESISFVSQHLDQIREWIENQIHTTEQTPPLYSALKKQGKRYSDHARAGVKELPPARKVTIYSASLTSHSGYQVTADFSVSGGTYIRSIARDLGEEFQFPVHLAGLRRSAIGSFLLNEDCWRSGEEVRIRPPHEVLTWPRVKASDAEVRSLLFGQTPRLQMPSGSQFAWIVGADGLPVAWAEVLDYGLYRVRRIMKG